MQSVRTLLGLPRQVPCGIVVIQTRNYMRGFRGALRPLKSAIKKSKVPKIDPALYDPNFTEPISGSVIHPNIAEERERDREFASDIDSLTARGFLRFQKPYEPPEDAEKRFLSIVRDLSEKLRSMTDEEIKQVELSDSKLKYDVLSKASTEFDHSVPNSMLAAIRTVGAAANFYCKPIRTTTPFDELVRMPDLPPNLHVQAQPLRFTDDTLHLHGGLSAFPKDSTIVTGLRAKQKYKGHKAKQSWP